MFLQRIPPPRFSQRWRVWMTSRGAPVTSEGHGVRGVGTLAGCGSAKEKTLCGAATAGQGGGPAGPGGPA